MNDSVSDEVNQQRVLIIHHSAGEADRIVYQNILKAVNYARFSHSSIDLAKTKLLPSLASYSTILFATSSIHEIPDYLAQSITKFVSAGGGLVTAVPLWHYNLAILLGIEECSGRKTAMQGPSPETTIEFVQDFFPGLDGQKVTLRFEEHNFCLRLISSDQLDPIALSEKGEPIAWKRDFGRGKVVCWNTQLIATRFAIGLVVQSILATAKISLAPIANTGVIQIDDFPAGFSNISAEPLLAEFGLKFVDFIRQFWLPDILQLGEEYGIPYTFFTVFNFNHTTSKPFPFLEWEAFCGKFSNCGSNKRGICLSELSAFGELGFHGYNHLPLTEANWRSKQNVVESILEAFYVWDNCALGSKARCYVPPMNEIDSFGVEALVEAAPQVAIISTHYLGDFSTGSNRDFGPEPLEPRLFSLPRLTHGYELDAFNKFIMTMGLSAFGVWTHFFHPDDVIDTPGNYPEREEYRNPLELMWRRDRPEGISLYNKLKDWFEFSKVYYPWLQFRTTSDAKEVIEKHFSLQPWIERRDGSLIVRSDEEFDFQLRIDTRKIGSLEYSANVSALSCYTGPDYALYMMRKTEGTAVIFYSNHEQQKVSQADPVLNKEHEVSETTVRPRFVSNWTSSGDIKSICFVVDVENWAFHNITKNISRHFPKHFKTQTLVMDDFESSAKLFQRIFLGGEEWDHVHFFWHPLLSDIFNPETLFECIKGLNEEQRWYFFNRVARACKTTSVYCHQFLNETEQHRTQLGSLVLSDGYSVASPRLLGLYSSRGFLPKPISMLSDGVDLALFRPENLERLADQDRTIRIGWAGNSEWGPALTDNKGLRTVICPLIERLSKEGIDIVGEFCDRKVSWRPRTSMPSYYNSVDIYVCASLSEGTPNPVLEAMACGLPVLSTDVGIVSQVLGPLQKEFVVSDRNSTEFAAKLRRLASEPELRLRLSEENLSYIKRHSWRRRAPQWIDFFSSAAQAKSPESVSHQLNALFCAWQRGSEFHAARQELTRLRRVCEDFRPHDFVKRRLGYVLSGRLKASALVRDLVEWMRFICLQFSNRKSAVEWCRANDLPDCYTDFDWWQYLNDNTDLEAAGIISAADAARHWRDYGNFEGRELRPYSSVSWSLMNNGVSPFRNTTKQA